MVTSPPFGPTPEITTPPVRRRNAGDRSTCHGLLFRAVNVPPMPFTLPSACRVSSPTPIPRNDPCGPIWLVTAAGPIAVTTSCVICAPATVMLARSVRNVCSEVGMQPSPQLWVMAAWPRRALAVTVVPPPDAVAMGPGVTSNVASAVTAVQAPGVKSVIRQARESRPLGVATCSMAGFWVTSRQRSGCPSGGNSWSREVHGSPVLSLKSEVQRTLCCWARTATSGLPAGASMHTPSAVRPSLRTGASQDPGTSRDAVPLLQKVRLQAAAALSFCS